ncbi:MAG: hypothetical protein AB8B50_14320 [Pirellulaceae bacterium]
MSWTPILVIAAIAILVPTALVAAFASTKDTYQYSAHYSKHGFTQETREELIQLGCAKAEVIESDRVEDTNPESTAGYERPVADWPTEL